MENLKNQLKTNWDFNDEQKKFLNALRGGERSEWGKFQYKLLEGKDDKEQEEEFRVLSEDNNELKNLENINQNIECTNEGSQKELEELVPKN